MPTAGYKTCSFCLKEVEKEELENHQLICRVEVECGNECGLKLSRQMLLPTRGGELQERKVVCDLCKETFSQEDIEDHMVQCFQQYMQCMLECGVQVDDSSLSDHLDEDGSKSLTSYNKHHDKEVKMCVHSCAMCLKEVKPENMDILRKDCVMSEVECVFCDSFVPEDSFVKHYGTCESALVRCGNKCGEKKVRKDLSEHYENECPKALVSCEHCEKKVKRQLLKDHHAECVKFPIPCPESCGVEVGREDMKRHLYEECQKRFAACAYKDMQCSYEGFPAGIMQHMKEEMQQHMDLLKGIATNLHFKLENEKQINKDVKGKMENLQLELESEKKRNQEVEVIVLNLKLQFESEKKGNEEVKGMVENLRLKLESEMKRNEELKMEINTLRHESFLWKVKDVAAEIEKCKWKWDGDFGITSPPFYSSKHGYKLNVSITPYEKNSEYKGHLGVYIQLMPGEYDSILKWPFTKLVKFRLVDQATQDKDIVRCFRGFDAESFIKPKDGKCNAAYGYPTFVSHKVLSSRSYIVDNAMFLEVSVEE